MGIVYLVVTVPAMVGLRWGRVALLVPTLLIVAYAVRFFIVSGVGNPGLNLSLAVIALPPLLAGALLFVPTSRPYFARPAP